ncbi:unnamed protein product [Lampetra planeri]
MASTFGGAPRFLSRPRPPRGLVPGADATINCKIAGEPAPVVVWEKGGERLGAGGRYRPYEDGDGGYGLVISEVRGDDSGLYTCRASNGVGEAYMAVTLSTPPPRTLPTQSRPTSTSTPSRIRPAFESAPRSVHVRAGRDAAFSCRASGQPRPRVSWEKGGRAIDHAADGGGRYAVSESATSDAACTASVLRVYCARAAVDAAEIVCRAANAAGEVTTTVRLEVDEEEDRIGGGDGGGDDDDHEWRKQKEEEEEYFSPRLLEAKRRMEGLGLELKKLRDGSACGRDDLISSAHRHHKQQQHHRHHRHQRHHEQQQQQEPPPVKPMSYTISEGKHAKFSCNVTGKPRPRIVWKKEGRELAEGRRHLLYESDEGLFVLKVLYCRARDQGLYTCEASNRVGFTYSAVQLHVKEPPCPFRSRLRDTEAREGGVATLECEVARAGDEAAWFLEERRLGHSEKHAVESSGKLRRLVVRDLGPDDDGVYVCETADGSRTVAELSVTGKIAKRLPRRVKVAAGGGAVLEAEVARSGGQVHWLWAGREVRPEDHGEGDDPRARAARDGAKRHTLTLRALELRDSGPVVFVADGSRSTTQLLVVGADRLGGSGSMLPTLAELTDTSVTVRWTPLPDARGYAVERNALGRPEWLRCHADELLAEPRLLVRVPERAEYRFRVFALRAGALPGSCEAVPGTATLAVEPVVLRAPHDLRVSEGEDAEFRVELSPSSSPSSSCCWLLDGREVVPGGRYGMRAEGHARLLVIRDVDAGDSGARVEFRCGEERGRAATLTVTGAVSTFSGLVINRFILTFKLAPPQKFNANNYDDEVQDDDNGNSLVLATGHHLSFPSPSFSRLSSPLSPDLSSLPAAPDLFVRDPEPSTDVRAESGSPAVLACRVRRPGSRVRWLGPGGIDLLADKRPPPPSRGHGHQETGAGEGSGGASRKEGDEEEEQGEVEFSERSEGTLRELTVRTARPHHSGEYACATSDDSLTFRLSVAEPPATFVSLEETLTSVEAVEGECTELSCVVSRGDASVAWLKEGRALSEQQQQQLGLRLEASGTLRRLVIERAQAAHAGVYTCDTGHERVDFTVRVAEPPATFVSLEETLTSVEAVEGERAELSCAVSRGDASVAWLKEGRALSEQQQQQLGLRLEASGTLRRLVIERAQAAHAGVYTCDTGHERVDFTVRVAEPPATFVSLEETLTSVEAVEGERAELSCVVSRGDASVAWLKEGRALSEQQQQQLGLRLEASGTLRRLVIERAQAAHAGVYTCDTGHERVDFTVRVAEPPATFVSLEETLTSVEAVEGERAELSCAVSRGDASVAWLKEGRALSEQQQQQLGLRLEASGTLRRLVIERAQAAHAGVYTCDTGHERVDFTVRVAEPPARFVSREETLTEVEAVEGEDVALGCEVSRDDAAVSWQRAGGEELSDDERREQLSDGVERALVLHGCEAADAGTYVCVTRDGDAIEFHVRVTGADRTRAPTSTHTLTHTRQHTRMHPRAHIHSHARTSSSDIDSPPKFSSAVATPSPLAPQPPRRSSRSPCATCTRAPGSPLRSAASCRTRGHAWPGSGTDSPWGRGARRRRRGGERWEEVEEGARRELRIACVALEHEGEYTCETGGDVTSAWLAIEVPRPVEFVSELHGLTVLEGEDATFRCSVLPADAAVRWELRGAALEAGGRASLHEDGAARSLLLRAVTALDAGEVAALADGAETRALLRVQEAPVSFVRGLEATAAEEGDDVVFTVELSRAQAEVRWARNGVLLNPGAERADLRAHGPLRSLTVRSVSFSDRGVYSCESLHERTQARLSVEPRQVRLVQAPSAVEATERGTATFSLRLSHADVPGQWFRDAAPVSPGPLCRVAACGAEHSLTLAALSLHDSGLVSFQAEGVHCSARLTVREPPVRFVRELEETRAPEKSRVTLECEVSREFADVKWYKDGEEVKPGGRCRLMSQGPRRSLLVPRCEHADSGIYACVVTGDARTEAALRVHARDVRMVQRLTECDVEEGQAASFDCETTHDEVSAVWTLNGTRLKPGDNIRIRDEGTRHSLVLACVRAEDAGEVGFSAEGAECTTQLRVRELPVRITKPLRDKIAIVGRRAVLECRVSRATARVSWQHGGRELAEGGRYQMGAQGEYRTLVIVEAAFSDEGSYTCRAGEASSSARLLVEGTRCLAPRASSSNRGNFTPCSSRFEGS